jgi:hypothetical protein
MMDEAARRRHMPPEDIGFLRQFFDELGGSGPEGRALYATLISRMRASVFSGLVDAISPEAEVAAATIASEGIADLGVVLDPAKAAAMLEHFRAAPVYAAHVAAESDGVAHDLDALGRTAAFGSYQRDTLYSCPHLIELANEPRLLQIAERYLGCPPTIYSFNAWWSFPQSGSELRGTQHLHRDLDDLRFLTLFVYLTPVTEANGPHRYIRHSHDKAKLAGALTARGWQAGDIDLVTEPLFRSTALEFTDIADTLLGDLEMLWTGPAGAAVLADTYGLHMGRPPVDGARLIAWVRYGLGPNRHSFGGGDGRYAAQVRARIPQTERARYVNRLLLTD